jgi:exopolyphosphatase/guanosine-5'-triphosphate,3'-diphosphate pyrophosphatase
MIMGCAILEAICRRWSVGRLRVADRGIREGILMAMIAENKMPQSTAAAS